MLTRSEIRHRQLINTPRRIIICCGLSLLVHWALVLITLRLAVHSNNKIVDHFSTVEIELQENEVTTEQVSAHLTTKALANLTLRASPNSAVKSATPAEAAISESANDHSEAIVEEKPISPRKLDLNLSPDYLHLPAPPLSPDATNEKFSSSTKGLALDLDKQKLKERIDGMLASALASKRIERGEVDHLFYDIERKAKKLLYPDWTWLENSSRHLGSLSNSSKDWLLGLGKAISDAAKGVDSQQKRLEEGSGIDRDLFELSDQLRADSGNLHGTLHCEVCIDFTGQEPLPLTITRGSGVKIFDLFAKHALNKAIRVQKIEEQVEPLRVCYDLSASIFRLPPLPLIGCTIDEMGAFPVDCFYPLKKFKKTEVKLVRVEPLPKNKG